MIYNYPQISAQNSKYLSFLQFWNWERESH